MPKGPVPVPSLIVPADESIPSCPCGLPSVMVLLGGLGGSYRAVIHEEDAELVAPYHWYARRTGGDVIYAERSWFKGGRGHEYMHKRLSGYRLTDHENGNGLDNRRCNLREATHRENCRNSGKRLGSSKFKGVSWHRQRSKWRAQVVADGRNHNLGLFASEAAAARAYDVAALELHGEFAKTNAMLGLL